MKPFFYTDMQDSIKAVNNTMHLAFQPTCEHSLRTSFYMTVALKRDAWGFDAW